MVSVLVAAYNSEKTIQGCLESIAMQSYSDLEIVVVDDGSTDKTGEICDAFSWQDGRFFVRHQANAGVSAARNAGLAIAHGEYVTIVDADDMLMPDAIEKLVAKAKGGAELVVGSHVEFRGNRQRRVIRQEKAWNAEDFEKDFSDMDAALNHICSKLYLRKIIEENQLHFDESMQWGEDHAFNLAYCKVINQIRTTSEIVYRYRMGGLASSVRYYPNKAALNLALMKRYEAFFDHPSELAETHLKRVFKQLLVSAVAHYLTHCSWACAQEKIKETLCLYAPYFSRAYIDEENYTKREIKRYMTRSSRGIAWEVFRRQWRKIAKRKTKKLLMGMTKGRN